jgi:hypothetical protein
MQRVNRTYLKGLRIDIGRMVIPSKPATLIEAEKEAGDIERYLREEQPRQLRSTNRHPERRPQNQRSTAKQGAISHRNPVPTDERMQMSYTQENHPFSNQIDRTPCMPHLLKQ